MTKGALAARVEGVAGPKLTVTYKGGQQTIIVDPKTPIVGFEPGAQSDLKPGAAIVARGAKQDDGSVDAGFVLVGKDGLGRRCDTRRRRILAEDRSSREDLRPRQP